MPRSGIAGSCDNSIFDFVRTQHAGFYSGRPILLSHQQCTRVPIAPHPHSHLFLFFIMAMLMGVQWYLTVVLMWISLMIRDVERLFMCLLANCVSLEKCLFKTFDHF